MSAAATPVPASGEEELERRSGFQDFKRVFQELRPFRKLRVAVMSLTMAQSAFGFVPPLILGQIVNQLSRGEPVNAWMYLALVVGFALAAGLLGYATNYLRQRLGHSLLINIREKIYGHMQSLPLAYFNRNKAGKLVSNVMNDPATLQQLIVGQLNTLISDAVQLLIVLVLLFTIDPFLAMLALIATPAYALALHRALRLMKGTSEEIRAKRDEMYGDMQEKLSGIHVVKGFGKERWEMRSFYQLTRGLMGLNVTHSRYGAGLWTTADALSGIGQGLILYFGGMKCIRGEMEPGTLVMFLLYSVGFVYGPIVRFLMILDPLAKAQAALHRIFRTMDQPNSIQSKEGAPPIPPVQGHIRFDNVWFEYTPGVPVLKGINLEVQPGELVAFVGFSGSGKTTMANLLLRHYDPTSGSLIVDGHDLRDVDLYSYRRQVGYVIQDSILFNTTIEDNIRYGRPTATREAVVEAAKAANCHDLIDSLPKKYDTRMGEEGISLSIGEQQRLAIARALLADPKVLIMDEATSSLDSQTEALVQEALDRLLKGRTSFVIAHRLSTILKADKIVVLEEGEITALGTHKELIAQTGSLYERMYQQQFSLVLKD